MSDRELLELAAKAAGYGKLFDISKGLFGIYKEPNTRGLPVTWNPLIDDGDALRLMVLLKLDVNVGTKFSCAVSKPISSGIRVIEQHNEDPISATRMAIVRAAAEIGRNMP